MKKRSPPCEAVWARASPQGATASSQPAAAKVRVRAVLVTRKRCSIGGFLRPCDASPKADRQTPPHLRKHPTAARQDPLQWLLCLVSRPTQCEGRNAVNARTKNAPRRRARDRRTASRRSSSRPADDR